MGAEAAAAAAELGAGTGEGLEEGRRVRVEERLRVGAARIESPRPALRSLARPALPGMERCGPSLPRARGGGAGPATRLPPHLKGRG